MERGSKSQLPVLADRAGRALIWSMGASAAKLLLTVFIQAAFARLLGPAEFGLFAICIILFGLAMYFADAGFGTSLIHQHKISDEDVSSVWTLSLVASSAVALVFFASATVLAELFSKPELTGALGLMAPVFVLNAASAVSVGLMRRALDYRRIQLVNLTSYTLGFGAFGILMAWQLGSVQAMVLAFGVQALLSFVLLYRLTRHTLKLRFTGLFRGAHIAFGGKVLATNLVNWLVSSADRLLVAKLFPAASIGSYTVAHNLMSAPAQIAYPSLQSVFFSATARLQNDTPAKRRAFLDLIQVVALGAFPVFTIFATLADCLVRTIYGPAFAEAVPLVKIFAAMSPFLLLWAVSTPILWNSGRPLHELKAQLPFVAISILAVLWAAPFGLEAVALTAASVMISRTVVVMALACRALGIGFIECTRCFFPAIAVAAATWMAVATVDTFLVDASFSLVLRLITGVVAGVFVILLLVVSRPALVPDRPRQLLASIGRASIPACGTVWTRFDSGVKP